VRLVKALRGFAGTQPFDSVSRIYAWHELDGGVEPDWLRLHQWLVTCPKAGDGDDDSANSYTWARPRHVVMFTAIGRGSETAAFGLARYPETVTADDGTVVPTGAGDGYDWRNFCKTQYASLPRYGGFDHFLRIHGGIVAVLDEAERLGMSVDVRDDGKFWDHRDAGLLRAEVDRWNGLVAVVAGKLKDKLGEAGIHDIIAPITDDPLFEHLEAKGQELLEPPDDSE